MPYTLSPGLVFGPIIGSLFRRRGRAAGWRLPGHTFAAALASCGAIYASIYFEFGVLGFKISGRPDAVELTTTGFVGGLVWSLLLGLASIPLLRVPPRVVLGLPVVIGAAFGLLLSINWLVWSLHYGDGIRSGALFEFFVFWPGAYAAASLPCCVAHLENSDLICAAIASPRQSAMRGMMCQSASSVRRDPGEWREIEALRNHYFQRN